MSPVLNSDVKSEGNAIDLAIRMSHIAAKSGSRSELLTELANQIAVQIDDQVFLVIAELEQQWKYRDVVHLGGFMESNDSVVGDLYDCASRALHSGHPVYQAAGGSHFFVASPILVTEKRKEILVSKVDSDRASLAVFAANLIQQWDQQGEPTDRSLLIELASVIEKVSELESCDSLSQGAQQAAQFVEDMIRRNTLQGDKQFVEVHIGFAAGTNQPRLIASLGNSSNSPEHKSQIEAAMAESKTRQRPTIWPAKRGNRHAALCHESLAASLKSASVMSFEITDHVGNAQGVILIATQRPLSDEISRKLQALSIPIGSTLNLIQRAEQNQLGKIIRSITDAYQNHRARTIALVTGILILFSLIPMPYMVNSECELQPEQRRFVSVPFDAKIESSQIQPGDLVKQGDELAKLQEREIRLELAQVQAELYRAKKDLDGLVAKHESGEASLARLKAEALEARQQLLRYRFDHLIMRSPVEGIVVSGDFKDADGMSLSKGDPMFEISSLETLRLNVLVPAEDIHWVKAGAQVFVRFDSLPFESFEVTIDHICPSSELRDQKNVFLAKATLENPNFRLRPGMRGTSRIKSTWQPVAWHYLRKPVSYTLRWIGW